MRNRKATYCYSQQFFFHLFQFILFRCSRIKSSGIATFDTVYLNRWLYKTGWSGGGKEKKNQLRLYYTVDSRMKYLQFIKYTFIPQNSLNMSSKRYLAWQFSNKSGMFFGWATQSVSFQILILKPGLRKHGMSRPFPLYL